MALFVLILIGAYAVTGSLYFIAFLIPDFLLRTINLGKYSVLGITADAVIKKFNIGNKPVDRGPKRFAAGTGLAFTSVILISAVLKLNIITTAFTACIALFALLEAWIAFCAGCYVYSFIFIVANKLKADK